jgi:hypothetical protein
MFMYVIHVHAKGGKHGKVKANIALETDDCLWAMHENWCHAKPPPPYIE